jgi:hypothetical protein
MDFAAINARLKEIQSERAKGIQGTAEPGQTPGPPKPEDVTKNTVTGSGGFITPAGKPYKPDGHGGYDIYEDCG